MPSDHAPTNTTEPRVSALVRVDALSHSFDGNAVSTPVLDHLDLSVYRGEFVALIGPSGCGKTTLLRLIGGLLPILSGSITVDGMSPDEARRCRKFGYVPQSSVLLPWRTVLENVLLPLQTGGRRHRAIGPSQRAHAEKIARKMLETVGLADREDLAPLALSGGMRSRVALARALVYEPVVLLLDEPFAHLDELTRRRLNRELARLHSERTSTSILVTHSLREALFLADRVFVLSDRPTQVLEELKVEILHPRSPDIEDSPEFIGYLAALRDRLEGPQ